jgi:4-hydroxy-tetrahydrodipicolinate synthase
MGFPTIAIMSPLDLSGLWVPLVTPFLRNGNVDHVSLDRLCRHVLAAGANGVCVLGTTGEPATLDGDEQIAVVTTCSAVCAELDRPMLVGVGTNSTRTTVTAAEALREVPAVGGVLVVVPYYTRPSVAGVIEHYRVVAAASPVPVVAYNVPYRTGVQLGSDAILKIASIPNVIGLKQSVGQIDVDTLEILRRRPDSFRVLAGDDAFIVPTIAMGGSGAIAAAAHLCTPIFASMISLACSGDVTAARRRAEALLPVVVAGFAEPNPAVWKAALVHEGVIETMAVRAPMQPASAAATQRLVAAAGLATSQFPNG